MYIHFEGLDLAGKSTLCRRFTERASGDWEVAHNALTANNPVWSLSDRLRKEDRYSEATIGWCYHAALLADLEDFRPPGAGVNRLQDSTILLRALAHHIVAETPGLPAALTELLESYPRFDRSFVCVASFEVRCRRLTVRDKKNLGPEDFIVRDDPGRFRAMEEVLVEYAVRHFDAMVIDTSNLEQEQHRTPDDGGEPTSLDLVFAALPGE